MSKYALLLSGGVNKRANYARYKNDLEWAYKVLVEDCNYEKENIKIFYADGKELIYADEKIATAPAEKTDIIQHMDDLASLLNDEDSFAVIVSNHGGKGDGGCINLWGDAYLELEQFVQLSNQIKGLKYIILGECYGGNILDWKIDNSCIITANEKGQLSYTNPDKMEYDELILHLFSFIHGKYPDGKAIVQGENDLERAYQYACDHDALRPGSHMAQIFNVTEIPQMECNIVGKAQL